MMKVALVAGAGTVLMMVQRTESFLMVAPKATGLMTSQQQQIKTSKQMAVVVDAETTETMTTTTNLERSTDRKDSSSSSSYLKNGWRPAATGARSFLPNLGSHALPVARTQSKPTVLEISGIHEYKQHVVDEANQMVCVRFYAKWCRSCRAIAPAFKKLPEQFPQIKFVQVPVTSENAFLHQGLQIPSLPFGHLYHPDVGLVEEVKIGKKDFKMFREILETYTNGFCLLDDDDKARE